MEFVSSEFTDSVALESEAVPGKEVAELEVAESKVAAESGFVVAAGEEGVPVFAPTVVAGACDCVVGGFCAEDCGAVACVVGDCGAEDCVVCAEFILFARERLARSLGAWFCLVQPENRNTNEIERTNILTMGSP